MNAVAKRGPGWLDVRVRRVAAGDGEETAQMLVHCPFRGRTMDLAECAACDHAEGLTLDSASPDDWALYCARAATLATAAAVGEGGMTIGAALCTPISALMSRDVVCVREDVGVEALTALFLDRSISGAPVVDEHGRAIGVVSKTDLLRERREHDDTEVLETGLSEPLRARAPLGYVDELGPGFHAERAAGPTVRDIMTPLVFALPEDAPVSRAAALMAYEGVHRIPVLAKGSMAPRGTAVRRDAGDVRGAEIVGILSSMDVLRWVAEQGGFIVGRAPRR